MSILINKDTKLVVQGITGRDGAFHARKMKAYGTQVVAGVSPGKGGQIIEGIPIFNTVADARSATGANASVIFVPASFAADAILEASYAGIELVVTITEGVPVRDMIRVMPLAKKERHPADRAQLSGTDHTRRMPDRYPSREYLQKREHRTYVTQWYFDL